MLSMTFQSITHPDDLGADLSQVQRLLDGEIKSYQMEKRYRRVDGEFVFVLLNASLVRDAKGAPLHFIAQIQDVTERKQAEQAIKDSEERFQLVVQGTDDGIWDWHMDDGYCYFSPRYSQLLGYPVEEFPALRSTFESHLHPDDREAVFAALRVHLDQRTPYDVQYRLRLKNGDYRWFHARGQAFWDETGKPARFAGAMHDVTQNRQAAIALERSQKFLDAVLEAVPQALFVKDQQHRWVLFNQAFSDLAGQDRAVLVGKSDPDIMPAELARRSWDEDDRAFAQDGAVISEIEMIRHDGSKRWLLKSKRRVALPDGDYIVGVATDVTGMKTIQSALTQSEELHRLLADNSSDMITRLTPDAIIEYASPASVPVLGFAPDELKDMSVGEFIHPDDVVAARARFVEVVKQNEAKTVTCRLRRKRGGWVWVETSFRAVREPGSSRTSQVIGVSRDVDERVHVTEALNRFKHVLDNTLDMIFMYDPADFRFSYVNLGAANNLGYTREQLIGLAPWDIRGDITEAQYRIWVQPLLKGEMKSSHLEAVFRRADGSEFPVDATIQLVNRPGETPVLISIIRDATERKKVDRMKSEFISTVSHELRTPLTSIRGSLGLIVGGALGPVADQTLNLIRIAHSNSERLVRLINDILDIEKVESGSMRFDMQP
ncbi:MAG: PAS domain S-box protein, partial [Betaproteobacteria bacterium]